MNYPSHASLEIEKSHFGSLSDFLSDRRQRGFAGDMRGAALVEPLIHEKMFMMRVTICGVLSSLASRAPHVPSLARTSIDQKSSEAETALGGTQPLVAGLNFIDAC